MASVDEQPCEPRTVSKRAFCWYRLACTLILAVAGTLVFVAVSRWFGGRLAPYWGAFLTAPSSMASCTLVDRFLRRRGRSLSGKTVEVLGRADDRNEGGMDDEVVELRLSAVSLRGVGWTSVFLALLIGLCLAVIHSMLDGFVISMVCLMIAFFFFGLGGPYLLHQARNGDPLVVRTDASGISGYPVGLICSLRFVPWSEVATCEIETFRNTFGQTRLIRPILKRYNGEIIMKVNLVSVPLKDSQRLVQSIKARFPRVKCDSWIW